MGRLIPADGYDPQQAELDISSSQPSPPNSGMDPSPAAGGFEGVKCNSSDFNFKPLWVVEDCSDFKGHQLQT